MIPPVTSTTALAPETTTRARRATNTAMRTLFATRKRRISRSHKALIGGSPLGREAAPGGRAPAPGLPLPVRDALGARSAMIGRGNSARPCSHRSPPPPLPRGDSRNCQASRLRRSPSISCAQPPSTSLSGYAPEPAGPDVEDQNATHWRSNAPATQLRPCDGKGDRLAALGSAAAASLDARTIDLTVGRGNPSPSVRELSPHVPGSPGSLEGSGVPGLTPLCSIHDPTISLWRGADSHPGPSSLRPDLPGIAQNRCHAPRSRVRLQRTGSDNTPLGCDPKQSSQRYSKQHRSRQNAPSGRRSVTPDGPHRIGNAQRPRARI
jgi:hypothetical protein